MEILMGDSLFLLFLRDYGNLSVILEEAVCLLPAEVNQPEAHKVLKVLS